MDQDLVLRLFFVMFFLAIIWLGLVAYLFRSLKQSHPAMYESLGSPRGFEARTTQALITFLLSRRPESLQDIGIRQIANVMRVLLFVYLAGFAVLLYFTIWPQHAA